MIRVYEHLSYEWDRFDSMLGLHCLGYNDWNDPYAEVSVQDGYFDPDALICSEPFQKLLKLEQAVSPFEVYGIESSELAHSRVLGRLLASEGSLGYGEDLMPRLAAQLHMAGSREHLSSSWIARMSSAKFRIRIEYPCWLREESNESDFGRLDLLLEDESKKIAVVIEVKIWAGEQDRQIERYQTWLTEERKGWQTMLIYLTPKGSDPTQWHKDDTLLPPCACLSWRDVYNALDGMETNDKSGVVKAFRENIWRHIMGESEKKNLVREIMADPTLAETISTIIKHLPKIEEIEHDLKAGVKQITGMEIETKLYPPSRGDVREIMIYLKPWKEAGIPICFNFYDGDLPAIRTMVHVDNWKAFEPIAKQLASLPDTAVHKVCPIRRDWNSWRLVMIDDSDTNEAWQKTTIQDRSYSPDAARALLALFHERFEKLNPTIQTYLQQQATAECSLNELDRSSLGVGGSTPNHGA